MVYKIWDKEEKINGVDASTVIEELKILQSDEVFIVLENESSNRVSEIQFVDVIKSLYNLNGLDSNQVAEEYLRLRMLEADSTEKDKISIDEMINKIDILVAENKALNTKVDTVKFTHSDLILDMDFRLMDIEDSIGIAPTTKLFMRIGEDNMNSTFMLVLDKIEMGNYSDKNEIEGICDRYLARNRINSEEYDTLMKALDKKELEKNEVLTK